jgi:hypothetical protein
VIPFFIFSNAAIGACLGFLLGACLALLMRTPKRSGFVWDALIGGVAFPAALYASDHIRTAPNTVTRRAGNMVIRSTALHYQHPYFAAFLAVIVLVVMHRAIRTIHAVRSSR